MTWCPTTRSATPRTWRTTGTAPGTTAPGTAASEPADDGPSADPGIAALRRRQQRNFLAMLLVSRGVPMLLAGDERNRTQQGNNNAYCQDNAISWVDWSEDPSAANLTAAVRSLVSLRASVPALRAARFPEPAPPAADEPVADTGLAWFNPDGSPVTSQDWGQHRGSQLRRRVPRCPSRAECPGHDQRLLESGAVHRAQRALGRLDGAS